MAAKTTAKVLRALAALIGAVSLYATAGESAAPQEKNKAREKTAAEKIELAQDTRQYPENRCAFIQGLTAISDRDVQDNRVVEGLLDIAVKSDDDPRVRVAAISALGEIEKNITHDHRAKNKYIGPFAAILKTADGGQPAPVRKAIAKVFDETLNPDGPLDRSEGFKALADIARNKDEKNIGLRHACILAVGNFGDVEGLSVLAEILNEPDQLVKEKAAVALSSLIFKAGEKGSRDVALPTIQKLLGLLNDSNTDENLKISVMSALAQLIANGNTSAARAGLQPIKDIVAKDINTNLVIGGIQALGIVATADAVEPLKKAYDDNNNAADPNKAVDVRVRVAVIRAIDAVIHFQAHAKPLDAKAVSAAGQLLVHAIDFDAAPEVKHAAVFALSSLQDKHFSAIEVLADPDDATKGKMPLRAAAIEALLYLTKDSSHPPTPEMKEKIESSLEYLTGLDFGVDKEGLARWWKWWEENKAKFR